MKDNYILAFETSCDETSVAILKNGNELLCNIIASQINSHKRFGGVVPEIASITSNKLLFVLKQHLKKQKFRLTN